MPDADLLHQEYTLKQAVAQMGVDDIDDVLSYAIANQLKLMFRLPPGVFIVEFDEEGEFLEQYSPNFTYLNNMHSECLKFERTTNISVPFDFPCVLDNEICYDSIRDGMGSHAGQSEFYFAAMGSLGLAGEILDENGFIILPPLLVSLECVWVSANELRHFKEAQMFRALGKANDLHRDSALCTKPKHDGALVFGCSEAFFEAMTGGSDLAGLLNAPSPERIKWTAFEASRRLAGIAPANYPESGSFQYDQFHDSVLAAQRCADQILYLALNEQRESQTPQEWLAWADLAKITVYPPCRRLIEFWCRAINSAHGATGQSNNLVVESSANHCEVIPPQFSSVRGAANKVLIAAAWQIEQAQGSSATLAQAIDIAKQWHEAIDEPAYIEMDLRFITEIDHKALCIKWNTRAGKKTVSDFEVLGKALARWNERRKTVLT